MDELILWHVFICTFRLSTVHRNTRQSICKKLNNVLIMPTWHSRHCVGSTDSAYRMFPAGSLGAKNSNRWCSIYCILINIAICNVLFTTWALQTQHKQKNLRKTKTLELSSVDVCCCLMDLDFHALRRCNVIGAHILSDIRVTICCSRKHFNHPNLKATCLLDHYTSHMLILGPSVKWKESDRVSRLNYSILQFRTAKDWTLHQVYERVCSLNCKPQLKQAGLCICCFLPFFLLAVVVWSGSVFVQRVIKVSDQSKTLAQNLNFFSVASK